MCDFLFGDRRAGHLRCQIEWRAATGLLTSNRAIVANRGDELIVLVITFPGQK
jgi:hypothetical protein